MIGMLLKHIKLFDEREQKYTDWHNFITQVIYLNYYATSETINGQQRPEDTYVLSEGSVE